MVDAELFARYQRALGTNADLCKAAVKDLLARLDGLTPAEQAEVLLAEYPKLVRAYGKVAADVARQYYQQSRDEHFGDDPDADGYVAQAAQPIREKWAYEDVRKAASSGSLAGLPRVAVRRVMQRADETISLNCRRDPAKGRWAIVPHPGACGWCVMVASNGWGYTERSVNAQRHDGCKCSVAVDFDRDKPELAGYDVDELRRQYALGVDEAGDTRAQWEALPDGERRKYQRKGRSAYDVFRTQQIAKAMDARIARVEAYRRREKALEKDVKAARRGGLKTPRNEWENRIDRLLTEYGLPSDSIHVQHGTDFKPHELLLAARFTAEGHDVELLYASSKGGSHTPDYRIDGVPMEAKRLEAWSVDRLGKKIHEASAQSRDVIIDLSLETVSHDKAIGKARDVLNQPMYRFLSKYERKQGYGRGKKEIRVDSVTLVFHDRIEVVTR